MTDECPLCGDDDGHSPACCPWALTCGECLNTGVDMLEPRLCVECAESTARAAAMDYAYRIEQERGDYLRDLWKDEDHES